MLWSRPSINWTDPKSLFNRRSQEYWIYGVSQHELQQQVEACLRALHSCKRALILCSDPLEFLAAYMACVMSNTPVFLGNPAWTRQERQQAKAIASPDLIWTDSGLQREQASTRSVDELGWIMVPTGGTSGQIKFAIHTWETLSAAVLGMQSFFFGPQGLPIHSYCVLPLYHVSGLMQWMRSLLTGGKFAIVPYKTLLHDPTHALNLISNSNFFLSLVPTQLSRLLVQGSIETVEWLSQFHCILLGGAPSAHSLLKQARQYQLPVAPTYGMTETGAQVMTLRPKQFLAGQQFPDEVLPHVQFNLVPGQSKSGQIEWSGLSICYGYYPNFDASQRFLTDDIAQRTASGQIQIQGRASRTIISGGENIHPEEIEAVIIAIKEINDVCVFGMPDVDWGEIAIAAYVTSHNDLPCDRLTQHLKTSLASYKCPKVWWRVPSIPRNPQGKVNLKQLKQQYSTSFCNGPSPNPKVSD